MGSHDRAPVGVVVLDEEFRIRLINNEFKAKQGDTASMLAPGALFEDFLRATLDRELARAPEQAEEHRAWFEARLTSLHRRENSLFEDVGKGLKINRRYVPGFGTVITNVDISDQKAAERKIEEARQLLDATVENAPVGIVVLDEDLHIVLMNSKFMQTEGIDDDELI